MNSFAALGIVMTAMKGAWDLWKVYRDMKERADAEGRDISDEDLQLLKDRRKAAVADWLAEPDAPQPEET